MFVWLPRWPIDRRRLSPNAALPLAERPFVLVTSVGNRRLIAAVDAAAAGEGIAPGMTLADARALRPDLVTAEADFAGDAAALAKLAQWCGRYSPWTAPTPPDGIFLDVTGCAHLQGSEDGLLAEIAARLGRRGIAMRAAIADTPGAAAAVARFGTAPLAVVPPNGQRTALADLPVAALRLPPETVPGLVRVGLRRIGEFYPMARPSLVLRFGHEVAARLDQALGARAEPLSPVPPPPLRWARRRFAEPIATVEGLRAAASTLLEGLCRTLARHGEGARRLELTLYRVDGTPLVARIGTARPSRDPRHLIRLFDERWEAIDPGLGIEDMMLVACLAEPQAATQLALGARAKDEGGDVAALIDRLTARLGEGALGRPLLVESHVPERSVRIVPPLDPARNAKPKTALRPVRMLRQPEPVEAVAPVPDDPPLMFRWRKVMHRVRRADGPERIAGEWWRGGRELRDYYRVEDQDGRRFWLYRAGLYHAGRPARWYLHGVFA
jgi:protein ImuB